jgi:hypothetical protein
VSVLAQLERLDHRFVGRPETDYVFESRKWRMRIAVLVMLTNLSLIIAFASDQRAGGWFLVLFSIATFGKTIHARREWRRTAQQPTGRFFE